MNEEAIDALTGQIAAVAMTLTAIITTLHPAQAGVAAVQLENNSQQQRQEDDADNAPPAEIRAKYSTTQSYIELLKTIESLG